jgi:hypothetical protein
MRCDLCGKHFGLARWRHHCCHCDREVCAPCKTPHRLSTPANARKRACAACVAGLASDGRRATAFALPRFVPGAVTTLLSVLHGAHSVGAGVFGFLNHAGGKRAAPGEPRVPRGGCGRALARRNGDPHHGLPRRLARVLPWRACSKRGRAARPQGRGFRAPRGREGAKHGLLHRDNRRRPRAPRRHPRTERDLLPRNHQCWPCVLAGPKRAP